MTTSGTRESEASDADPTPSAPQDEREAKRLGMRVLGVTTLGLMFVIINGSSVNVALPDMSADFGVGAATADWFLLAFMLANTASILALDRKSTRLNSSHRPLSRMPSSA